MDAFDMGEQVLTLGELSQRANLPKSTVHRLVEQLRAIGWVERDHSNGYRVGMRLFELGGLAMQRNQLRDTAFPHLHALATTTGLAVQLGVLDRGEVVYLERIVLGGFTLPTRLGGRMPAYCTGLGKAMLAFDDAAADDVLVSALAAPHRSHDHRARRAAGQPRPDPFVRRGAGRARVLRRPGLRGGPDPQLRPGDRRRVGDGSGEPHGLGGEHRDGQADRHQHLELPLRCFPHRSASGCHEPPPRSRPRLTRTVRLGWRDVVSPRSPGSGMLGSWEPWLNEQCRSCSPTRHECSDDERNGGDRRDRQHRDRPDVQAAPVRRDRPALHGRHRPGERRPGDSLASTASKRSRDGVDWLLEHGDRPDIVFEATSAYAHVANAPRFADAGIRAVDLTPAAIGPYVIPVVNLTEHIDEMNVNMVTCGGQATIPMVYAVSRIVDVPYAEIVATVASKSAGPGTRANIDEFTRTTSSAVEVLGGAKRGKAIIILNPAEPPLIMRDTIFCQIPDDADHGAIEASIDDVVAGVQQYVPGYRLRQRPQFDPAEGNRPARVAIFIEVEGAGDYLPPYSGNLDIMTAAATKVGEEIARHITSPISPITSTGAHV